MEDVQYDKSFTKGLRTYLRKNFDKVNYSYRYRVYETQKKRYKGIVVTGEKEISDEKCFVRFEVWGGEPLVEVTIIFGSGKTKKFFRSYIEIGKWSFGEYKKHEFDFINKLLDESSTIGNNALDFILR